MNGIRSGYGKLAILAALLLALAGAAGIAMANYAAAATQTPIYSQGVMANSTSTPERFTDNDDDDDDDDDCVFGITTPDGYGLSSNKPMVFTGTTDGVSFTPQRAKIDGRFDASNTRGSASCRWRATSSKDWITLQPASGTTAAQRETSHQFAINEQARELDAGVHRATITFAIRTGFLRGNKELYVKLEIIHPCRFQVDQPDYLKFEMQDEQDTAEIKAQTVTISNPEDSATCQWTATSGQNWLDVEPTRGELDGGAKSELTVSLNPTADQLLAKDGHELDIRFRSGDISESVTGRLDIEPLPCQLGLEPTPGLTATGAYGGPFAPEAIPLELTNEGGKDCRWSATSAADDDADADNDSNWAAVIPFSGTIEPGKTESVSLRVARAADALAPGAYPETIVFSADAGASKVSVIANLKVATLPCQLTAQDSDSLEFRRDPEGNYNREQAEIAISNGAHRETCQWTARAGDWLTVNPSEGQLAAGESATVTATLDQKRAVNLAAQQGHRSSVKISHSAVTGAAATRAGAAPAAAAILEIPASLELECLKGRPCAVIHSDRTTIRYDESVETTLTLHNRGDAEIVVTLTLSPPSGWSLAAGDFGDCSASSCTKRARIAAGESEDLAIQASPNEPSGEASESVFQGIADYHPSAQPDAKDTQNIAIPVTVMAATEEEIAAFQSAGLATPPPAPAAATPPPMATPTPTPNPAAAAMAAALAAAMAAVESESAPTPTPDPAADQIGPPAAFIGPRPNSTPTPAQGADGAGDTREGLPESPLTNWQDLTIPIATLSFAAVFAVLIIALGVTGAVLLYRSKRQGGGGRPPAVGRGAAGRGRGGSRGGSRGGRRGSGGPQGSAKRRWNWNWRFWRRGAAGGGES